MHSKIIDILNSNTICTIYDLNFLAFFESYLSEKKELLDHYAKIIHDLYLEQDTEKLLYILVQASICEDVSLNTMELELISDMSYYLLKKHLSDIEPWLIISKSGKYQTYRVDLQKLDEPVNNG